MASSWRPSKNPDKRQVISSSSDTDTDEAPIETRVVSQRVSSSDRPSSQQERAPVVQNLERKLNNR